MEVLFEFPDSVRVPEALVAGATRTGSRFRIEIPEPELYAKLDALRSARARVLSVAQLKPTLEDFFLDLIASDRAQPSAVEVSSK